MGDYEGIVMNVRGHRVKATQADIDRRIEVRRFIEQNCKIARTLPTAQKCLFVLHFESGFSYNEIARLCHCDVETVRRRIQKVVEEIKDIRDSCNGEYCNAKSD